ncbi:putative major facilitator, sugar transporter, major facilitator superfamily [Rosa chinensis]|uniref:Putative major facilitator, sugar transporter, major facilitator superfamily n=1 Tax=Rosa chinensis TaxID=74649 RepID=A0A2P6RVB0_ROSCH|nr:organic cation/carnitine transporter 4 [Rosa chinensis]PRQ50361.1 putative major facilitator, sugar transporter, major facilitator superfamily [Rosa chinensis]
MTSCDPGDRSSDLRAPLISAAKKSAAENEKEKLCIDDMLQKYCGEFGPWQVWHFVLTSLAWALEAFHTMVMIFADREPSWRCLDGYSGCDSNAPSVCGLTPGSWEWLGGPVSSTVAEWGLVCEEKYKVGLAQALFFGGCMIGAGVFGHFSDSFLGRKGSLTAVCVLNTIFGCLTAFSPNYWGYVVLRFLTGFSTGGVGLCAFVLATEPVGPTKRGAAGMSTFYFFSTGIALLAGIAYIYPSWRELYIASSIPSFLFLVAVLPFLSESPRWYLVRGKVNEATKLMRAIAKSNGNHLPSGVILTLDEDTNDTDHHHETCFSSNDKEAMSGSLIDVIKSPMTRIRLFLAVAINFLCSVVYYGLSLNVVNLGTNLYLNVLLNAVAEMPAFTITAILLDKYGRKPLAIGTLWFSGIFCLVGSLMKSIGIWKVVRMVCGILGIFGMAGTYNLLFIYTMELFPTVVRNAALGCATQAAQMGAILAPFVVVLGGGLPFAVFAACGIAGGVFAFYLPETLNKPLYDTMAGMEDGESTPSTATVCTSTV